jgi:hypothetical protein
MSVSTDGCSSIEPRPLMRLVELKTHPDSANASNKRFTGCKAMCDLT